MAGTKTGGRNAAQTNKKKYGEDFYQRIGRKGGSQPTIWPKGFAAMPAWKREEAGRKGGSVSRRGPMLV